MQLRAFLAGLICLYGGSAAAQVQNALPSTAQSPQSASPQPSVFKSQSWARKPNGEDIYDVFPKEAVRAQQYMGAGTMSCLVGEKGGLEACTIVEEQPTGFGFGDATLKLAKKFRAPTNLKDGRPTAGGKVLIPVIFRWPG